MPWPDPGLRHPLVIDWAATRNLCARIGPTALALVLELASTADQTGDGLTAAGSVRDMAGRTGLGKDTVNRHLRRLESAGTLTRLPRSERSGPTRYRLHLQDTGITQSNENVRLERDQPTRSTKRPSQRKSHSSAHPTLPFTA